MSDGQDPPRQAPVPRSQRRAEGLAPPRKPARNTVLRDTGRVVEQSARVALGVVVVFMLGSLMCCGGLAVAASGQLLWATGVIAVVVSALVVAEGGLGPALAVVRRDAVLKIGITLAVVATALALVDLVATRGAPYHVVEDGVWGRLRVLTALVYAMAFLVIAVGKVLPTLLDALFPGPVSRRRSSGSPAPRRRDPDRRS